MRTAVDVHTFLVEQGVAHEFFRLDRLARTLEDVASELGVTRAEFVVARVLTGRRATAVALTQLGDEIDAGAASAALGADVREADPAVASLLTGFPAQWIPPVAVPPGVATVVDRPLAASTVMYGTAGEPGLVVAVRVRPLVKVMGAIVARIARPITSKV